MTTIGGHTATTKTLGVAELRRFPVHRHAGIFRVLEGDERDRLRDSIRSGYDDAHPIVVWKKTNEIVDGRNRRDLAVELKCTNVPVSYVAFPNEEAVTGFIIAENLARRHLTTKERAQLAGDLVVNGTSVRTAAKSIGVSKTTTQRAANKARARVPNGTPVRKRTTGADGKSYPATKATPSTPPAGGNLRDRGSSKVSAEPAPKRKQPTASGKRLKYLYAKRRAGDNSTFMNMRLRTQHVIDALECADLKTYGLEDADDYDVRQARDELRSLKGWVEEALTEIDLWLGDAAKLETIAKLEASTTAGLTGPELEARRAAAARKRTKLAASRVAGRSTT